MEQPDERAEPSIDPIRLTYLIGRLDHAVRRELDKRLAAHDLTVAQFTTLSVLTSRPGLSNAQLARRVYVTPQSMNAVLNDLERKGLITRKTSAEHRRVLEATLTKQGRATTETCHRYAAEVEELMLAGCTSTERAQLTQVIRGCLDRLNGTG